MITVAILINGQPIHARTAVNQAKKNKKGETAYKVDTGEIVWHDRDDGAIELAKKLLDTIKEQK